MTSDTPDAAVFDPPDPDRVYRNYVAQCRRLGVTPLPAPSPLASNAVGSYNATSKAPMRLTMVREQYVH
jgi:hypothetical protein